MGYLCRMRNIGRYSKWVTLIAATVLVASCFMPWAYYPDLGRSFTGWKTEQNVYGMPGKWFSFMALFSVLAQFIPSLFLKRANLLFMALNLAYAVFTFVKYNRSYGIITPTIQYGSWIMVLASLVLMLAALFPSGTLKPATGEQKI